jgi:hypothetical protein
MPRISGMDMLKAVVADITTIDEAHRGFYVAKDGKFYLNVTPVDGFELDNVSGLKTALGAERNNVSVLRAQLTPYEGLDATAARTALERITAFGDITPDAARTAVETAARLSALNPEKEAEAIANTKFETLRGQLTTQFTARETELTNLVTGKDTTITGLTGQLQTLMRDNAIKSELANLNPLDDARDAIELLAGQFVKTSVVDGKVKVDVVDANGNPRIKDHLGTPVTVTDLLTEIKVSKPALFKAEDKRGFGVKPGSDSASNTGTANPWVKETFNFTQQGLLENTNPALAKQMKEAAGVKD